MIGGLWLLVPVIGWLMNMGHRVRIVHRMHHGRPVWPAWGDPGELLVHGVMTFLGMAFYTAPGIALGAIGYWLDRPVVIGLGATLWLVAVVAIPGYMSHYCKAFDRREIFNPVRALSRVRQGGRAYWKAWGIVAIALPMSLLGLLGGGIGLLFTSVWFWQVAAFSFATVFTQRFELDGPDATSES